MNAASLRNLMFVAALLPVVSTGGCSSARATPTPTLPAGIDVLKASLVAYSSPALAKSDGYSTAITDCMSNGDDGAMGVHLGKPSLIDATVDSLHPEALIFEPGTGGEMSLVGVEFIVPFTAHARDAAPPELFGQKFAINDVFHVWALHVWTHRANPKGVFAPWNPRVHC